MLLLLLAALVSAQRGYVFRVPSVEGEVFESASFHVDFVANFSVERPVQTRLFINGHPAATFDGLHGSVIVPGVLKGLHEVALELFDPHDPHKVRTETLFEIVEFNRRPPPSSSA
jgi:hypothetical protein